MEKPVEAKQIELIRNSFGLHWIEKKALLKISGPDCPKWLQGMTTQDVLQIEVRGSAYGLFLNVQGKVIFDAWILRESEEVFVLSVDEKLKSSIQEHLEAFIIMEDVELAWLSDVSVLSIQGDEIKQFELNFFEGFSTYRVNRLDLDTPGIDVIIPDEKRKKIQQELNKKFKDHWLDEHEWEQLRVIQNVPKFGVDFGDFTLPQEAGLKEKAVSFTKGCYVGQEPVVMLEHRGKPPKRVVQFEIEGPTEQFKALQGKLPVSLMTEEQSQVGKLTSLKADPMKNKSLAIGHLRRKVLEQEKPFFVENYPEILLRIVQMKS